MNEAYRRSCSTSTINRSAQFRLRLELADLDHEEARRLLSILTDLQSKGVPLKGLLFVKGTGIFGGAIYVIRVILANFWQYFGLGVFQWDPGVAEAKGL